MSAMLIRRILCPTDFSEFSVRALEHAIPIARWFEAQIVGLYVEPILPAGTIDVPQAMPSLAQRAAELEDFLRPARAAGVPAEGRVAEGNPVRVILETVLEDKIDLVAMGTHGRSGFERFLLGSVTETVIRKAPCAVLTVCHDGVALPRGRPPFKRILCAVDFSTASDLALNMGFALAHENDACIQLLHVVDTPPAADLLGFPAARDAGALERAARERLLQKLPASAAEWCTAQVVVAHGRPSHEIVHAARHMGADLVVMGVHGHNPVHLAFFGATTHWVVREAPCAVLSVRTARGLPSTASTAQAERR